MEDMARLALVEESVRDIDKFRKILYELLHHINHILENPHDYELRTIKSNILKEVARIESFCDYLKYVGFEAIDDNFVYPNKSTLSNLRMAQGAIERKINFCFGSIDNNQIRAKAGHSQPIPKMNALKENVLTTTNRFLLKIQDLFINMIVYEEPELQALAREKIPLVTLQLMALDRVREQQMQLKTGKIKGNDLPFDIALLMELLVWFKHKFFSWVDKPDCDLCKGPTTFAGTSTMTTDRETCRVELYKCLRCPGTAQFPRYNDLRTLLRTRRGRCGEWANCFTLLCRALGYDTRYVYDTTDHVWCEIFDFDSNTWLHCDPCEASLNAPLTYCHGWGKQISYVIALSRDDLQDVTWRYTMRHKEVLKRRKECSESELIECIVSLRSVRQRHESAARRAFLARRAALELVHLMRERTPSDYESHGRISGSAQWRAERGEDGAGVGGGGHTFLLTQPATYTIRYYCGPDKYRIWRDGAELPPLPGWGAGTLQAANVFRKVEQDWRMVYLARSEGSSKGSVSWKVSCDCETGAAARLRGASLSVRATSAQFETGQVQWTVAFDDQSPTAVELGETPTQFSRPFSSVTITALMSGGVGDVGWQHAQLFRQPLDGEVAAFELLARVEEPL